MDETCWEQVSSDQREVDETFDPQSSQNEYGSVTEWSKVALSKSVVLFTGYRGFKSLRFRSEQSEQGSGGAAL